MPDLHDLDAVIELSHRAIDAFAKGDSAPLKALYSRADDVTIANPFGPPARGWRDAARTMDRAATNYRDGEAIGFDLISEYRTPTLAYILEIEHIRAKLGGAATLSPVALRVTTIFRPEAGTWRIVHRHADPITAPRSVDSLIEPST